MKDLAIGSRMLAGSTLACKDVVKRPLKGFLQSKSLRNPDWITCLKLFYHIVNTFRKVPDDIFMISIKYFERSRYF